MTIRPPSSSTLRAQASRCEGNDSVRSCLSLVESRPYQANRRISARLRYECRPCAARRLASAASSRTACACSRRTSASSALPAGTSSTVVTICQSSIPPLFTAASTGSAAACTPLARRGSARKSAPVSSEDQHVFVGDQQHPLDRLSLVVELEEARARDELTAAQAAEECDVAAGKRQAGAVGEPDDLPGQVDERALRAVGADGEYEPSRRGEHAPAAGQDLCQRVGEGGAAAAAAGGRKVGEVVAVARVAVVPLLDRTPVAGLHLAVQRVAV